MKSMGVRKRGGRCLVMVVAAVTVLGSSCAMANGESAPAVAASGVETAVWAPKEFEFVYREFTTRYTCDGLRDKMKRILIKLGARPDLQVRAWGCTRLVGPDPFAGVKVRMHVLQPAAGQSGKQLSAHWQTVDVLSDPTDHDPADAAGDCELVQQLRQQVLPLFATRNIEYGATCERHHLLIGATTLKAQVLIADAGGHGASDVAAR